MKATTSCLAAALLALLPLRAETAEPYLIEAINMPRGIAGAYPHGPADMNGELYSNAYDGTHGSELWRSDGTAAGTEPVKGIQAGSGGAEPYLVKDINTNTSGNVSSYPRDPANMNGKMYFSVYDGTRYVALWRSDGTEAGTVPVKGVQAGSGGVGFMDELYFSGDEGTHGAELWRSDGTEAGTKIVKDIRVGSGSSAPIYLTNANGVLYLMADDGTHGLELWRSDGTEVGTVMVKDINAGSGSLFWRNDAPTLTNVNGTLYFKASDGTHGSELWRSDGTEAGTLLVKDIQAGSNSSYPQNLTNVNGTLYFSASDGTHGYELWRSNGTEAGTVLVKDIATGNSGSYPSSLTNVNGTLYFGANDGTHGQELWRSDGTEAGTLLVKDIQAGSNSSYPQNLTNVNGTLYFSAYDGIHGQELWRSDGTAAGTVLVKDIQAGSNSSYPQNLTNVNGTLYFSAYDGTIGYELWRSDGTEAGTLLVKDIQAGGGSSYPYPLITVNGTLYFRADDGIHGQELWAYILPHTVMPSAGMGGTISPGTPQTVEHGTTISFTVTPSTGYYTASVTGCGGTWSGTSYTTGAITADCTVIASFQGTDSDGDGIGDAWEMEYFGNLTTANAGSDYDKDGYSDKQEYLNWLANQNDPAGSPYNPKVKNVPGGTGWRNPAAFLPAVYLLLPM